MGCHRMKMWYLFRMQTLKQMHIMIIVMQLCGRCLVNMTPVVKVVIHCVVALLSAKYISDYYNL